MDVCFSALHLLYARLEEQHGLARRAIRIYERATEAVLPEERFEVNPIFDETITLSCNLLDYELILINFINNFHYKLMLNRS